MRDKKKKRKKGPQKKGGENSPISPPLDPRLNSTFCRASDGGMFCCFGCGGCQVNLRSRRLTAEIPTVELSGLVNVITLDSLSQFPSRFLCVGRL